MSAEFVTKNITFGKERANKYDQFSKDWILNYDVFCQWLSHLLMHDPYQEIQKILVVGCGTGKEMQALLNENIHWQITGIDPSPEMLRICKRKLTDYPVVDLIEGEVKHLIHNYRYHAATLQLVLQFQPDDGSKLDLLAAIGQRLSKGAPLIIFDIFGGNRQFAENLKLLESVLPPHIPQQEIQFRLRRIQKQIHNIPEFRLSMILEEAGFTRPTRFFQSMIFGGWICRKK